MSDSILIIENDPTVRRELLSALAEAGFIVAAVPDYSAALLKLNQFKADLVIVDIVLPSIDGIKACQQIQSVLSIPVVLLGEGHSDEAWDKAVQSDTVLYEIKPLSYRILVAKVKVLLRRFKARREKDL